MIHLCDDVITFKFLAILYSKQNLYIIFFEQESKKKLKKVSLPKNL